MTTPIISIIHEYGRWRADAPAIPALQVSSVTLWSLLTAMADRVTVETEQAYKDLAAQGRAMPLQDHGWQDISTAPKDGTTILVCHKTPLNVVGIETAHWRQDNWLDARNLCIENPYMRLAEILVRTITHWQPVPAAPAMVAEEQTSEVKS